MSEALLALGRMCVSRIYNKAVTICNFKVVITFQHYFRPLPLVARLQWYSKIHESRLLLTWLRMSGIIISDKS